MPKAALATGAVVFAAVAAVHLARLILGTEIVVGGTQVPVWVSAPVGVVFAGLAVWLLLARRRS